MHFADQLDLLAASREPACSRAELGTCLAPCAGRCTETEYDDVVRATGRFLEGGSDLPLERLLDRMADAAERREYEMAARYRDSESTLRKLRDDVVEFRQYLEGLSFVYRIPLADGSVRAYFLRNGRVRLSFDEPEPASAAASDVACRFRTLLSEPETPPASLSPEEREELFLVARWFRARPEERLAGVEPDAYLTDRLATGARKEENAGPSEPSSSPPRLRRRKTRA